MYPVTEAYLLAVRQHTVATRWVGQIRTKDGVVYDITPSSIEKGSGKLTRQICPSKNLVIGGTCSAQLDLKLKLGEVSRTALMGAQVSMTHQLRLADGTWEDVPLGEFEITDPPERKKQVIGIHAYDHMQRFNATFGGSVVGKPYDILLQACRVCNVELGTSQDEFLNLPNAEVETWNLADIQIYTWRDLVGFMASYLCCYALCGPDGKLYVRPYTMEPCREVPPSWRFSYAPKDYETWYTSILHYFHISQEYESIILAAGGLEYDLGENPFIQFNADDIRKSVLTNIINRLAEIRYTPFSAKLPVDPSLLPGDALLFTGNHAGDGNLAAITKQVITLHGGMTVECCGDDPGLNVLTEQEKRLRTAARNANKDSMFYYDFQNVTELTIGDGQRAKIIEFHYTTTKKTHVDFHAEIKATAVTTEEYDEKTNVWTERDGVVEVTYMQGGDPVTAYYPVDLLTDGTQLMHLLYTWWASPNIISSFEVYIKCVGCSITVGPGAARGYLAGPGLVGDSSWDGNIYIYDEFKPVDFSKLRKAFTGDLAQTLYTPTVPDFREDFKRVSFFRAVAKRFSTALTAAETLRFTEIYDDAIMDKDGVIAITPVWGNADPAVDGMISSPETRVPRVIRAASAHNSNAGDTSYAVSFDGGERWFFWASDHWQEWTGGSGMTETMMTTIPRKTWKTMLEDRGTVMMRAILENDATLTDMIFITTESSDWDAPSHLQVECQEYYILKKRDRTELRYEWDFKSAEKPIDLGRMSQIDIDTSIYSEVTGIWAHTPKPTI